MIKYLVLQSVYGVLCNIFAPCFAIISSANLSRLSPTAADAAFSRSELAYTPHQ
jgi:hypothetical protein